MDRRRLRTRAAALFALSLLALQACAPQAPGPTLARPGGPAEPARTRVALLLPLSGSNAPVGQAALNAAQLALFEHAGPGVELVPQDTGGSPAGAAEAARRAIAEEARVLVGPLTAGETQAAGGAARAARVPMLAFTNDSAAGGGGVWALGVTPAQQARRLVASVAGDGARRLALVGPDGPFTRQLAAGLREAAAEFGLPAPLILAYPPGTPAGAAGREVATRAAGQGIDALLIAEAGLRVREVALGAAEGGLTAPPLRLMGHALWLQDAGVADPAVAGAIFPGPEPTARSGFEQRYEAAFGERPSRLAAIAYDATALALRAVRTGGAAQVPIGQLFPGADGALRLTAEGGVQRGLAVFAVEPGGEPRLVEPAPVPGSPGS